MSCRNHFLKRHYDRPSERERKKHRTKSNVPSQPRGSTNQPSTTSCLTLIDSHRLFMSQALRSGKLVRSFTEKPYGLFYVMPQLSARGTIETRWFRVLISHERGITLCTMESLATDILDAVCACVAVGALADNR
ncbi:hypothetical protein MN608_07140 [Microdochium nivale]|nr:hypothetical protein MN608_07140 [Microdochium nivale]